MKTMNFLIKVVPTPHRKTKDHRCDVCCHLDACILTVI